MHACITYACTCCTMHTHIRAYIHAYIHVYIHACIVHAYMHTYIHTYMNTHIHHIGTVESCSRAFQIMPWLLRAETVKLRFFYAFLGIVLVSAWVGPSAVAAKASRCRSLGGCRFCKRPSLPTSRPRGGLDEISIHTWWGLPCSTGGLHVEGFRGESFQVSGPGPVRLSHSGAS